MGLLNEITRKFSGVIISTDRICLVVALVLDRGIYLVDGLRDYQDPSAWVQMKQSSMLIICVLHAGVRIEDRGARGNAGTRLESNPGTQSSNRIDRQVCPETDCGKRSEAAVNEEVGVLGLVEFQISRKLPDPDRRFVTKEFLLKPKFRKPESENDDRLADSGER